MNDNFKVYCNCRDFDPKSLFYYIISLNVPCDADENCLVYLVCASANRFFFGIKVRDVISSCAGWLSCNKI